jgi:hypothetical protein
MVVQNRDVSFWGKNASDGYWLSTLVVQNLVIFAAKNPHFVHFLAFKRPFLALSTPTLTPHFVHKKGRLNKH